MVIFLMPSKEIIVMGTILNICNCENSSMEANKYQNLIGPRCPIVKHSSVSRLHLCEVLKCNTFTGGELTSSKTNNAERNLYLIVGKNYKNAFLNMGCTDFFKTWNDYKIL